MSRPRRRRATLAVVTVLTASAMALALSGCSAGTVTQTDTTLSGAPGAFANVGAIAIRDMALDAGATQVAPAGGAVGLQGTIVNDGAFTDRLVSITTPYAQSVTVEGPSTIAGDNALRLVGSQPGPVGPAQPDTRAAATARIVLRGVTQPIRPGPTYAITFTFERSGQVTVPVIVQSTGPAAG